MSARPTPLFATVQALNRNARLFDDPGRPPDPGPFVIVVDNFYGDPMAIRKLALKQQFVQYLPPLAEQVGEKVADSYNAPPAWFASALLRHQGKNVRHPFPGFRHAPGDMCQRLSDIVGAPIDLATWQEAGDWWNGAFHVQNAHWRGKVGSVHHHYKHGDLDRYGWSGLVYLTPHPPTSTGTSIWMDVERESCVAPLGSVFYRGADMSRVKLALMIENRFNRLVLFRENVLHRAEDGFGQTAPNARLTQTFFFHVD